LKLDRIVAELEARKLTPGVSTQEVEVSAGFVSDLLSDVLAHAPRGGVLVTVQVHMNVIAVAVHAELSAVIFASGRQPDPLVVQRAEQENVSLYVCEQQSFDVVGRLYELGLRGQS
jgi:hypothetical protein